MSAFASGEIFFSSGDVAFAAPSGSAAAMLPGDPVAVHRTVGGRDVVVARGSVFRSRPEHIAVTITSGRPRSGDRIAPWDGTEAVEPVAEEAAAPQASGTTGGDAHALPGVDRGRKVLVYGIVGAPRILRDAFDASFADALSSPRASGGAIVMSARSWKPDRVPAAAEMRAAARNRSADVVLVPVYRPSRDGDSVAVSVYDGRSGLQIGYSATRIRPFLRMSFSPESERVGALIVAGHYADLQPAPSAISFDRAGILSVDAMDERFALEDGSARFLGAASAGADDLRRASTTFGGATYDVTAERTENGAGGRVTILRDSEPLFAADYAALPMVAASGSTIAVLAGDAVDVLRIESDQR